MTGGGDDTVLEARTVGSIKGEFVVPAYQRGYRWGPVEVTALLDDIHTSEGNYYLQPIVVRHDGDGTFEVIDRQQRLTTLYLIFSYIRTHLPKTEPPYHLRCEARPRSAEFLRGLGVEMQAGIDDSQVVKNLDFHSMHRAALCIEGWFESRSNPTTTAISFHNALEERVHVIWYEVGGQTDPRVLFTRLNTRRIPLTNAELVKALILAGADSSDPRSMNRSHRVAALWDRIEGELRQPQ